MAPIRIGIVGLAAQDIGHYTNGTWGVQHFRALKNSPEYRVTAVCNSSVKSAQAAIDFHKIDGARAYGDVEDLASDLNVDMVGVSVTVRKHFQVAKPVLLHGKDLYIEFPVAQTFEEVKELQRLAKENNAKVVIGAQAISDPMFKKVADLLRSKAIGHVSVASLTASLPIISADGWPESLKRFLDIDGGDNRVKVGFGHLLAAHNHILGSLSPMQTIVKNVVKTSPLLSDTQEVTDPAYPSTAPDTLLVQGVTPSGAASSIAWRTTRSTVDDHFLRWLISGTEGELELVCTRPKPAQSGDLGGRLKLRRWKEKEEVIDLENLDEELDQWVREIPLPAQTIALMYEHFARGNVGDYMTLDEGVEVHRMFEEIQDHGVWAP